MKAVGTVVGVVLIAIALLAIAGFIYYTISSTTELYNRLAEITGTKVSAATLASGVTGWWLQTGDTLTIHLENGLPQAVKITTITILWTDGSYTVYDKHDTPSNSLSAEIRDQQGNLIYQGNPQLPIALGVSWTADITIDTAGKDTDKVYITLSSSPVVAVVPLKNYYELYPPATGNATAPGATTIPPPLALDHAAYEGTVTWLGEALLPELTELNGTVYAAENNTGYIVSGNYTALQEADNNTLNVEASVALLLSVNNSLYYDDFSTDPFAAGRLVNYQYNTVNWSYDPATKTIYVAHSVLASTGRRSSEVADADFSVAYVPGLTLSDTTDAYIIAVGKAVGATSADARAFSFWGIARAYSLALVGSIHYFNPDSIEGYAAAAHQLNISDTRYGSREYYGVHIAMFNTTNYIFNYIFINSTAESGNMLNATYSVDAAALAGNTKKAWLINASGLVSQTEASDANYTSGLAGVIAFSYAYAYRGGAASASSSANITYYLSYLVVSKANPRYLNVTGLGAGWRVEVYNSSGALVASATASSDGVAVLNIALQPVIRGGVFKVYDSSGRLVGVTRPPEPIVGGNVYASRYGASVTSRILLNTTSAILKVIEVNASIVFNASTSVDYVVSLYDWSTGAFVSVYSGSGSAASLEISAENPGRFVASNGTVLLRIDFHSDNEFNVSVDKANVKARLLLSSTSVSQALFVANGGLSLVDVYIVDSSGTGCIDLIPVYTIESYTVFNGSADIAYDVYTGKLLLLNATGVYARLPNPADSWVQLTTACRATGAGARIEAFNTSTAGYALILPGEGNTSYCLIDTGTGSIVETGQLPPGITLTAYTASAADPAAATVYVEAVNSTQGEPVLLAYSPGQGWSVAAAAPAAHPVGLAFNGTGLWAIYERGSIYYVDPATGSSTYIELQLPFYPFGAGDRLEATGSTLLFVRADGTKELWCIPASS